MSAIHWVMSRLQFRRDMCQALYLPKGKEGTRLYYVVRTFATCNGRVWLGTRGVTRCID
jgi:hypothetical protein